MGIEHMREARWKAHGDEWPDGQRPCTSCKEMKPYKEFHKHSACKFGVNTVCKLCRKPLSRRTYENTSVEYRLWHGAKSRAAKYGREFSISLTDIVIQGECPVLKVPYARRGEYAPSLDRLDSSKGYVKGNIVVMSKRANRLKGNFTLQEAEALVKFLSKICEL